VGGVNRLVMLDNALGVHRFYGKGSAASAQEVMTVINLYLDRMGISRTLQDVASFTSADDMTPLTIADATSLNVAYISPALRRELRRRKIL
jgi:hypothetical protein